MHRTYVRRRLVALVVAVGVTVAVSGPIARQAGGTPTKVASARTYVVRPGDTLWSIASTSAPDRDPRAIVAEIGSANEIGSTVVPGQVLVVPDAG